MRKFRAFYGVLTEMARWLVSLQVSHVSTEATGIYTMPVYHALIEQARFEQVLVCNAAHVKNVPGRKQTPSMPRGCRNCWNAACFVAVLFRNRKSKRFGISLGIGRKSSEHAPRRSNGWVRCCKTPGSSWTRWPTRSPRCRAGR